MDITKKHDFPIPERPDAIVPREQASLAVEVLTAQLFQENLQILLDAARFADIPRGSREVPQSWIDQMGEERATAAFRVALYAQMSAKEAPVALKMATTVVLGVMKALEASTARKRPLSVGHAVEMPAPQFAEIEVDD